MKIKFSKGIRISKEGYFHLPLLYFACGTNGFILSVLGINIHIDWVKLKNNGAK